MPETYRFYLDKPGSPWAVVLAFAIGYVAVAIVAMWAPWEYPLRGMVILLAVFVVAAVLLIVLRPGRAGTWIGLSSEQRVAIRPSVLARVVSVPRTRDAVLGQGTQLVLAKNTGHGSLLEYSLSVRQPSGEEDVLWQGGSSVPEWRWLEFEKEAEARGVPLLLLERAVDEQGHSERSWTISSERPGRLLALALPLSLLPWLGVALGALRLSGPSMVAAGVVLWLLQAVAMWALAKRMKERLGAGRVVLTSLQFALYFTVAVLIGQTIFGR